jgi:hypothetical protein
MYLLGVPRSQEALWGMVESGGLTFADIRPTDAPAIRRVMHTYHDQPMDLAGAALV